MATGAISKISDRQQIILYSVLALAVSGSIAAIASAMNDNNISILIVISPAILAGIFAVIFSGKSGLKALFIGQLFKKFKPRWLFIALFGIPLLMVISVFISEQFGGTGLRLTLTSLFPKIAIILIISIGEEYGWRGYLLPKLQNHYSALVASLILALIWGFWHYPGYLIGAGVPLGIPFYVFLLWVIPMTIIMTWAYNNTGSILMPIIMHSVSNASFSYLPILPETTGEYTTFYIVIAIAWLAAISIIVIYKPAHLVRNGKKIVSENQ